MAVWTGSINGWVSLEVTYTESNIDIASNTSVVNMSAKIISTTSAWDSFPNNFNVKINGVTKADFSFTYDFRDGSRQKSLGSWSQKINHNADGSFSCPIYAKATMMDDSSPVLNTSFALTTIARASTPTATASLTMGEVCTINTTRASPSFTHTLKYKYGSDSEWVLLATEVGASYAWTVPNLAAKVPNSDSGVLQIRCETYNGSTLIGTKDIASTTLLVPASYLPTASAISAVTSSTGVFAGMFIQGKSTATITGGGTGIYGSNIVSNTITVKYGTTILGTGVSPYTTSILNYSGTISLTNTVTDSRGRTGTSTATITVTAYTEPTITSLVAYRAVSASGAESPTGLFIRVVGKGSINAVGNKNTKSTTIQYRVLNGSWTTLATDTTHYVTNLAPAGFSAAAGSIYEIKMTVADYYSPATTTVRVGAVSTALSLASNEKGAAIGGVFDESGEECQIYGSEEIIGGRLYVDGHDMTMYPKTIYGASSGVLIDTLLPGDDTTKFFFLKIFWNGYANKDPVDTILQGYWYPPGGAIRFQNVAQRNHGAEIPPIIAMIHGGNIKLWIPPVGTAASYITLRFEFYFSITAQSRPIVVSSSAKPGSTTYEVAATLANTPTIIEVPWGTDLNNYTTPGEYFCPANVAVQSMANTPSNEAFFLKIGKHAGVYQESTEYLSNFARKWFRNNYNGSWGPWNEIRYVVSEGGNSDTGYRKWSNRRMEQWKTVNFANQAINQALGSYTYWSGSLSLGTWPVAFATVTQTMLAKWTTASVGTYPNFSGATTTSVGNLYIVINGRSDTTSIFNITVYAEGTW